MGKQEIILLERKLVLQTAGWGKLTKSGFRRVRICLWKWAKSRSLGTQHSNRVLPSTITLEHTVHEAPQHRLVTPCFIFQQVNARKPK
jgi:hypothetical protein